jgi:subtilisin family serine protease
MAGPHARRGIRLAVTVAVATATALLGLGTAQAAAPDRPAGTNTGKAPVVGENSQRAIKDRYIVVMDKSAAAGRRDAAKDQARANGGRVHFSYGSALRGFAATLPAKAVDRLRANPDVAYIEADTEVSADTTQSPATWGLDRIDQRALPLNNAYTYTPTGSGVRAYIIDTGIRRTHSQFGGRAVSGYTAINDGRGTDDCNGHGTHVAGTVGGSTYGVAKSVSLYAVRVLDCAGSGTNSGVIAGVDWVTANRVRPAVANMSLGGGVSTALDTAVNNSINSGVTYAVAAGNDNTNACNSSPRAHRRGGDGRVVHEHRRAVVVLQLRHLPGLVRAGLEHHLGVAHQRQRDQHDQRDVVGDAARGGRRGAVPAGQHRRVGLDGARRDLQHLDVRRRDGGRHRLAEPAALLAADGRRRHASAVGLQRVIQRIADRHG